MTGTDLRDAARSMAPAINGARGGAAPSSTRQTAALAAAFEGSRAAWGALNGPGLLIPAGVLGLILGARALQRSLAGTGARPSRAVSPAEDAARAPTSHRIADPIETKASGVSELTLAFLDEPLDWAAWAKQLEGYNFDGSVTPEGEAPDVLSLEELPPLRALPVEARTSRSEHDASAVVVHCITFPADPEWSIQGGHDLTAGNRARVSYDWLRLPAVRDGQSGAAGWEVVGHYRINDHDPSSLKLPRLDTAEHGASTLELTEPGQLQLWFEARHGDGRRAWDSRMGENYRLPIHSGRR